MPGGSGHDYASVALAFTKALATRDYPSAYGMTSKQFQTGMSMEEMRAAFETIVPTDWTTVGSIEVGMTMESWPDKQPSDLGWAYVSVGGDAYSEAVIVVVTREGRDLRVRSVEFGRP
mgnify:CR=1 FL=1